VYLDKESDLRRQNDIFQQLVASATRPEKSVAWMEEIADGYKSEQ
jgi:hypothetical protein